MRDRSELLDERNKDSNTVFLSHILNDDNAKRFAAARPKMYDGEKS